MIAKAVSSSANGASRSSVNIAQNAKGKKESLSARKLPNMKKQFVSLPVVSPNGSPESQLARGMLKGSALHKPVYKTICPIAHAAAAHGYGCVHIPCLDEHTLIPADSLSFQSGIPLALCMTEHQHVSSPKIVDLRWSI